MQEIVVYLIVVGAGLHLLKHSRLHLAVAKIGSEWLLKRGQVKWAFRLRELFQTRSKRPDCH